MGIMFHVGTGVNKTEQNIKVDGILMRLCVR